MKRLVILALLTVPAGWFLLRLAAGRVNHWEMVNAGAANAGGIVCFGDSLVAGVGAEHGWM